jgi:hypothetical protein
MHKEVAGELRACVIHQVRIVESEGRSRKPKYDFKSLIRSTFFDGAVMLDERWLPREEGRSCQPFQLFPSSTMMRQFVRRPASF